MSKTPKTDEALREFKSIYGDQATQVAQLAVDCHRFIQHLESCFPECTASVILRSRSDSHSPIFVSRDDAQDVADALMRYKDFYRKQMEDLQAIEQERLSQLD